MNPVDLGPWIDLLTKNGFPIIFTSISCWLMWKYVPVVVQAHKEFLDKTSAAQDKNSETLSQLTGQVMEKDQANIATHKAMSHAMRGTIEAAESGDWKRVTPHLKNALDELS